MGISSAHPSNSDSKMSVNQNSRNSSIPKLMITSDDDSFYRWKKGSASNSESNIDEQLIPSPPLSPKINNIQCRDNNTISNLLLRSSRTDKNILSVVNHIWNPRLSTKNNINQTLNFLSEYRVFENNNEDNRRRIVSSSPRTNRMMTFSDNEKNNGGLAYQLRRKLGGKRVSDNEDFNYRSRIRKSPTPRRLLKPSHPHHHLQSPTRARHISSPLASSAVINTAPQYIPNASWEKLPDFSPPSSTLPPNNNKVLKVEWKGSPMDLSRDPLKYKLHPAELNLAQILRLPCDLYLDSKRRLFLEKVYRFKKGLPFRRTDAQKACRIDVNKASRLFAAFEKVGWLEDSNFKKYL
ncbi:hypothetical protein KAFR_0K00560 [Kazachstania africana CBS 2517]|uniref:SWIRM domain-containing protein n=1 Tax=Kazachstania africana (strain ATCC 22294 / BCRC 22015 / CBS 2517 / CECT 1963 / NBRC 1671 / NRRL Y-8276) TaxID=1071382 RepID=H2B1B1_KAZAF|nr:hypothetical protein KAFR_0K00560 [Kazachstania africana CBS 2517]CCF60411.1 hypothetical protein KAFR_0K00560 [Kazachstania africana CBS 2517]